MNDFMRLTMSGRVLLLDVLMGALAVAEATSTASSSSTRPHALRASRVGGEFFDDDDWATVPWVEKDKDVQRRAQHRLTEREILNQLYADTDGDQWISNEGWGTATPICGWFGVTCAYGDASDDEGVTALDLPNNNLARTMSSLVYRLPSLVNLHVPQNPLREASLEALFQVGDDVHNLASLESVDFSDCFLTHVRGLEELSESLVQLKLTKNRFSSFPTQIYALTNLQRLYLNLNNEDQGVNATISSLPGTMGPLAPAIGQLGALTELYAYSNQLTGPLPTELGLLDKLQVLSMANNRFTGPIPTEFNNLRNLLVLSLHGSASQAMRLTGPVPSFREIPRLSKVFLADNQLSGPLPNDFLSHNALVDETVVVNLRNNALTGGFPVVLRKLKALDIDLVGNQLTEPLPEYLCARSQWMHGLVAIYGCDAILCPLQTFAEHGQQTSETEFCRPCPQAPSDPAQAPNSQFYLGSTTCPLLESDSGGDTGAVIGGGGLGTGGGSADGLSDVALSTARILLEFYVELDGSRWDNNEGWDIYDILAGAVDMDRVPLDNVAFCSFFGIFCDPQGEVIFITLPNNRLHGFLPPSIFALPKLLSFDVSFNRIEISNLQGLHLSSTIQRLKLSHTHIADLAGIGSVADTLEDLSLDGIDLEQQLPEELYDLTHLTSLHIQAAGVTGQLSTNIGKLSNLRRLNLNENEMSESIPDQINLLTQLEYIDLSDNDWTGVLPSDFLASSPNLLTVRLTGARGGLGGDLPQLLALAMIEEVDFAKNAFSGPLPDDFLLAARPALDRTIRIHLADNDLTGPIPSSWAAFDSLFLELEDNQISGIPSEFCDLDNWMDGEVGLVQGSGCDAILCPNGFWNLHGKASTELGLQCEECVANSFFGETVCETSDVVTTTPEREILDELYSSTGGRYWNETSTNWRTAAVPLCRREGVVCPDGEDANEGVTELRMSHFGLRGTVPSSIYQLPRIRRIAFSWNPALDWSFEGIGEAQDLEVLQMSGTRLISFEGLQFAGPKLYELHIARNGLTGSFPEQLLQASSLREVFLSTNRLGGKLPMMWSNLTDLTTLKLDENVFTGPVPAEMSELESLRVLDLSANSLTGPLPTSLGDLDGLISLRLANQQSVDKLTGPLLSFSQNPLLTEVDVSNNLFAGPLPTSFLAQVDKSKQIIVNLAFNEFSGIIPDTWDSFQTLELHLEGNRITGIAPDLCDNFDWMGGVSNHTTCDFILCPPETSNPDGRETSLQACEPCSEGSAPYYGSTACQESADAIAALTQFYHATVGDEWIHKDNWLSELSVCTWYGVVCLNDMETVSEIRLENNGLVQQPGQDALLALAPILTSLRLLDIKGNSVDLNFQSLPLENTLEVLRLSRTGLSSLEGISVASSLTSLHAMNNNLAGTFPSGVLALQNLQELYLSFNKFNGTIPRSIGNFEDLEYLYLFKNEFRGQIPTEIGRLARLRKLILGENFLSGTIPNEFSGMSSLEQLSLHDQKGLELIEGPLPDFANAPKLTYIDLSNNDLTGSIPTTFLANVADKDQVITLLVRDNDLTGKLPESLDVFSKVFIDIAGNEITGIPSVLCDNSGWMNGAMTDNPTCNNILCPKGYFNELGREESGQPCRECKGVDSNFLGQTTCRLADTERAILSRVFEATNGDRWEQKESWGSQTPICSWQGVRCKGDLQDDDGVEVLTIVNNNMRGDLPSVIWALPSLKELGLRGNEDLHVDLADIGNAKALEVLDLSNTMMLGLEGLSHASGLREIYVDQTGLSGSFPSDLLDLAPTLEIIHMNWNFVAGSLPDEISSFTSLRQLHASGNDFHGAIPSAIGFLANLEELILDDCLLSGTLPATEISYLPSLKHFSANRLAKAGRKIRGPLPAFDQLPLLETLGLDGNEVSGTIPVSFLSSSTSVESVVLARNEISGTVPLELDAFSSLRLSLVDNHITSVSPEFCMNTIWFLEAPGTTPNNTCDSFLCSPGFAGQYGRQVEEMLPCFPCEESSSPFYGQTSCETQPDERAILTKLFNDVGGTSWHRNDYWLSKTSVCDWFGVGCDDGHVILINLSSNNLKGTVPSEIFTLPKLQVLWLNSNRISLNFTSVVFARNLRDLQVESCGLKSLEGIGTATSLTSFKAGFNNLAGRFPGELLFLENLRVLSLNGNTITGLLPVDLGELRYLRQLQLDSNLLRGPLPTWSSSPSLTDIHLAGNELTGQIPSNFLMNAPTKLFVRIDLSHNRLTGTVPSQFTRFDNLDILLKQNQITELPPTLCEKTEWNDGDVGRYGCDAILCPPGRSSLLGRRARGISCVTCAEADPFYGQALCGEPPSTEPNFPTGLVILLVLLVVMTCVLSFCYNMKDIDDSGHSRHSFWTNFPSLHLGALTRWRSSRS